MNKVILMGRLTRDPEARVGDTPVVRYSLAVDRKFKKDGQAETDFLNCVCFGKSAEFAEKYLKKGTKVLVTGRIQTGSYTNKDGVKVNTTDIVIEEQEFAESKSASQSGKFADDGFMGSPTNVRDDDFMEIPANIKDDMPF